MMVITKAMQSFQNSSKDNKKRKRNIWNYNEVNLSILPHAILTVEVL